LLGPGTQKSSRSEPQQVTGTFFSSKTSRQIVLQAALLPQQAQQWSSPRAGPTAEATKAMAKSPAELRREAAFMAVPWKRRRQALSLPKAE
jgi:hypothetical protein